MRKISRYTKLLIVSTLLTASFGLTTKAVRSQQFGGYSDSLLRGATASENARQHEENGNNLSTMGFKLMKTSPQQASNFFRQAAYEYNLCYGINHDPEVAQNRDQAMYYAQSLRSGIIPQ